MKLLIISGFKGTVRLIQPNRGVLCLIWLNKTYNHDRSYGLDDNESVPEDWFEAFHVLERLLSSKGDGGQQVIFIDELPWMDTPRSNFIPAFEHFCNDWCLARKNIKLVVCGSATSWILDNLINSKGGLYGRVTMPIYVAPFSLNECREFFRKEGFAMDDCNHTYGLARNEYSSGFQKTITMEDLFQK